MKTLLHFMVRHRRPLFHAALCLVVAFDHLHNHRLTGACYALFFLGYVIEAFEDEQQEE